MPLSSARFSFFVVVALALTASTTITHAFFLTPTALPTTTTTTRTHKPTHTHTSLLAISSSSSFDSNDNEEEDGLSSPPLLLDRKLKAHGKHICLDYLNFYVDARDGATLTHTLMRQAVKAAGVREVHTQMVVLGEDGESPPGFTGVVLIDESHVTAHCKCACVCVFVSVGNIYIEK